MTNKSQDPATPELSAEELDLAVGGAIAGGGVVARETHRKMTPAREEQKKSPINLGEETNKVTLPGDGSV